MDTVHSPQAEEVAKAYHAMVTVVSRRVMTIGGCSPNSWSTREFTRERNSSRDPTSVFRVDGFWLPEGLVVREDGDAGEEPAAAGHEVGVDGFAVWAVDADLEVVGSGGGDGVGGSAGVEVPEGAEGVAGGDEGFVAQDAGFLAELIPVGGVEFGGEVAGLGGADGGGVWALSAAGGDGGAWWAVGDEAQDEVGSRVVAGACDGDAHTDRLRTFCHGTVTGLSRLWEPSPGTDVTAGCGNLGG